MRKSNPFSMLILLASCSSSQFRGSADSSPPPQPAASETPQQQQVPNQSLPQEQAQDPQSNISTQDGNAFDQCTTPVGSERSSLTILGEDVPGNGFVGGPDAGKKVGGVNYGSDFDDYELALTGPMKIEDGNPISAKIGTSGKGTLSVVYHRGTTACSHQLTFTLRKCPNKNSTPIATQIMNIGTNDYGTATVSVPEANLFLDIKLTASGSTDARYSGCKMPISVDTLLYGNAVGGFYIGSIRP